MAQGQRDPRLFHQPHKAAFATCLVYILVGRHFFFPVRLPGRAVANGGRNLILKSITRSTQQNVIGNFKPRGCFLFIGYFFIHLHFSLFPTPLNNHFTGNATPETVVITCGQNIFFSFSVFYFFFFFKVGSDYVALAVLKLTL